MFYYRHKACKLVLSFSIFFKFSRLDQSGLDIIRPIITNIFVSVCFVLSCFPNLRFCERYFQKYEAIANNLVSIKLSQEILVGNTIGVELSTNHINHLNRTHTQAIGVSIDVKTFIARIKKTLKACFYEKNK